MAYFVAATKSEKYAKYFAPKFRRCTWEFVFTIRVQMAPNFHSFQTIDQFRNSDFKELAEFLDAARSYHLVKAEYCA